MKHRVGIVLSGGGARGVAHIGVLEALEEQGIQPTCISGNSSGAIVGALYAAGYSPDEMLQFFETKNPFRLSKVAVRKPGLLDTEKSVEDFLEYFPDDSFAALDKQLFVTATDVVNGRLEIFTSGPLIAAVLASSSVPLVFTPTEVSGRWLMDGGIINNFPVEPLKTLCDSVIGVYASPLRIVQRTDLKSGLALSHRALELGMYFASRRKFHECDILLCPEKLSRFGTFDTKHLAEIRRVGYQATLDEIDSIRSRLRDRARSGQAV